MTPKTRTLKNGTIKFHLEVTATIKKPGDSKNPLEFKLNLNPDQDIIAFNEALSTKEDLVLVFRRIAELLEKIDERTEDYAASTDILRDTAKKRGLVKIYEDNFKAPFEKIDRIIYRHKSPGVASVSYASTYNGDKRPSSL